MIRPADIKLMALDCEPVWLRRFCVQRHGYPANDAGDCLANRDSLAPPSFRSFHAIEVANGE
jgi:hypothetical protein